MILLLDVGNSSIKWAQLLDGALTPQQPVIHRDIDPAVWMKQLFRERFRPARLLVSNVAGPRMQDRIAREAQRLWRIKPEFATTATVAHGVTHGYKDVALHGIDRWLAIVAAYKLAGGAACVIDAGTAVTFDGVDARGLHLGGLIIPGIHLMIDSLLNRTADIAQNARRLSGSGGPGLLATNTAQAVANGAALAIAAAADRSIAEVTRIVGTPPKVFITGGDAPRLQKLMQTASVEIPDLVLQGLALRV